MSSPVTRLKEWMDSVADCEFKASEEVYFGKVEYADLRAVLDAAEKAAGAAEDAKRPTLMMALSIEAANIPTWRGVQGHEHDRRREVSQPLKIENLMPTGYGPFARPIIVRRNNGVIARVSPGWLRSHAAEAIPKITIVRDADSDNWMIRGCLNDGTSYDFMAVSADLEQILAGLRSLRAIARKGLKVRVRSPWAPEFSLVLN